MRYGYYPGCSLERMRVEYDVSLRNLFDRLRIQAEEVPGWICCGHWPLPQPHVSWGCPCRCGTWLALRKPDRQAVIAPCSACLYHFKSAQHQLHQDSTLAHKVEEILGLPLSTTPRIEHAVELLSSPGFERAIRAAVVKDLSDLKVVSYYGCLMTRPPKVIQFNVVEYPQSLDLLLSHVERTQCLICHTAGVGGAPIVPKTTPDHTDFKDDNQASLCWPCHPPAVDPMTAPTAAPTTAPAE